LVSCRYLKKKKRKKERKQIIMATGFVLVVKQLLLLLAIRGLEDKVNSRSENLVSNELTNISTVRRFYSKLMF